MAANKTMKQPKLRLTEMKDSRLGAVVDSLELGNVHHLATHGACRNEASCQEVLERFAVECCLLQLLATEMCASGLCAPHDAVNVDCHDLLRGLSGAIDESAVLPCDARVGDEHIKTAIEFLDDLVDGLLHGFRRHNIDLEIGRASCREMV